MCFMLFALMTETFLYPPATFSSVEVSNSCCCLQAAIRSATYAVTEGLISIPAVHQ
jgi:hypothetical protein